MHKIIFGKRKNNEESLFPHRQEQDFRAKLFCHMDFQEQSFFFGGKVFVRDFGFFANATFKQLSWKLFCNI